MELMNLIVSSLALVVGCYVAVLTFQHSRQGWPQAWIVRKVKLENTDKTMISVAFEHGMANRIDMVKMSVNGAETELRRSLANIPRDCRPQVEIEVPTDKLDNVRFDIRRIKGRRFKLIVTF